MDTTPKRNVGTTIMVLQEQYSHNKRLEAIYKRNTPSTFSQAYLSHNKPAPKHENSTNNYQRDQHLKNIKRLLNSITREKTMQERLKDQNDFFAYPALFFREVTVSPPKKKKNHKPKKETPQHLSSHHSQHQKISIEKMKHNLPILTNFDQYDLEQWIDSVNKMIINYNIVERDQLLSFAVKALSLLPKQCPPQFKQVAEKLMDDICSQKVDVW